MEDAQSKQTDGRGHASEMSKVAHSTKSLQRLRQLGFFRFDLPVGSDLVSEGVSEFNEVGFCSSGEVLLLIGNGFERVDTFTVRSGDVFFLPAGNAYSVHNVANGPSRVIVAVAHDGIDPSKLPLAGDEHVTVIDAKDCDENGTSNSHASFRQGNGYELLFRDEGDSSTRERTVAAVFDKVILAREFGVPEAQLPDMNFDLHDAVVVRPIGTEVYQDDGFSALSLD